MAEQDMLGRSRIVTQQSVHQIVPSRKGRIPGLILMNFLCQSKEGCVAAGDMSLYLLQSPFLSPNTSHTPVIVMVVVGGGLI